MTRGASRLASFVNRRYEPDMFFDHHAHSLVGHLADGELGRRLDRLSFAADAVDVVGRQEVKPGRRDLDDLG